VVVRRTPNIPNLARDRILVAHLIDWIEDYQEEDETLTSDILALENSIAHQNQQLSSLRALHRPLQQKLVILHSALSALGRLPTLLDAGLAPVVVATARTERHGSGSGGVVVGSASPGAAEEAVRVF
jgi:hypothetical protein